MKTVLSALALTMALGVTAADAKPWGGHQNGAEAQGMGGMMLFGELDANADGFVTEDELASHAQDRFAARDTNSDGFLDADELLAQHQAMMDAMPEGANETRMERFAERGEMMIERMMERFDADSDGKVSLEEMQAARPGDMFTRMDANSDGKISEMEFHVGTQHRAENAPRRDRQHGDDHQPHGGRW